MKFRIKPLSATREYCTMVVYYNEITSNSRNDVIEFLEKICELNLDYNYTFLKDIIFIPAPYRKMRNKIMKDQLIQQKLENL